jgi:hypothetical protein
MDNNIIYTLSNFYILYTAFINYSHVQSVGTYEFFFPKELVWFYFFEQ